MPSSTRKIIEGLTEGSIPVASSKTNYVKKTSIDPIDDTPEFLNYTDKHGRSWPPSPQDYTGRNGNLADSELKYLKEAGKEFATFKLRKDAADAFVEAVKAMKKVGLKPGFGFPISAYRDYNGQYNVVSKDQWIKTGKKGKGKAKTLTGNGYPAAYPGRSNHGLGVAIDLTSNSGARAKKKVQCWMKWFGKDFGWYWAGVNFREDWHFVYDPSKAKTFNDKNDPNNPIGRYTSAFNGTKTLKPNVCPVSIQKLKP